MLSTSLQDVQPIAPRDAPSPRASRKIYLNKSRIDSLPSLPFVPAITFHMEPQEFLWPLFTPKFWKQVMTLMQSHQDPRTAAELPTKGATNDATQYASFCIDQRFAFRKSEPKGLQSGRKMAHFRGPCWSVKPASAEQSTAAGMNFCQPAQETNTQRSICCPPLQGKHTLAEFSYL